VLRRKPDIRWRRKEREIISFSNLQLEILCHMSNFLKPGGVIVYGTCSIDKKENFNVVQNFLKINKDFKLDKIPSTINSEMIDKNLCFSTIKVIDNLDGMFAARLKKYD
jgi:16S rRNA (cytosine967-C5)-methyltransferase